MTDTALPVRVVAERLGLAPQTVRRSRRYLLSREGGRLVVRESVLSRYLAGLRAAMVPVPREEVLRAVDDLYDQLPRRCAAGGVTGQTLIGRRAGRPSNT